MVQQDLNDFQPIRTAVRVGALWRIGVTPPAMFELPTQHVMLTDDQYQRMLTWLDGGKLIQDALPDLTVAMREILMTGLGDEDFHKICGPEKD